MAAQRSAAPSEQRLFSLVLALVAAPAGATKGELLSSVYGYAERYRVGVSDSALERQFERDKEQLRRLGIRIETIDSPLEPGNNRLARYRISKEQLQLPSELRFDARELMLLRLAALAWSEGSMTAESRRAAMKLESLGAGLDVRRLGVAPKLGTLESSAGPLQHAIDEGASVRFDYEVPGRDGTLERWVAPLRLHREDGRWHLVAWDLERSEGRVFLLSRIRGAISATGAPFDPELAHEADRIVAELLEFKERKTAVLLVAKGSIAEARLTPRAISPATEQGREVRVEINTLDYLELADELVSFGPEVQVQEPAELRDTVVARLTEIVGRHG